MAKFKFLGIKTGYRLDAVYSHQEEINPGDVFELRGNDLVLMDRCISNAKAQGEDPCCFMPNDLYEMRSAKGSMVASDDLDEIEAEQAAVESETVVVEEVPEPPAEEPQVEPKPKPAIKKKSKKRKK